MIFKPSYMCEGLWEKTPFHEKVRISLEEENRMKKFNYTDLNACVDVILHGDPEALQHVLQQDPKLSEQLINKLELIAKKIEDENPDEILVQFHNSKSITVWRTELDYRKYKASNITPKDYLESSITPPLLKYYSEKRVKEIIKEGCLE